MLIEAQFHPPRECVEGDSRVGAPVTYKVVKDVATYFLWAQGSAEFSFQIEWQGESLVWSKLLGWVW